MDETRRVQEIFDKIAPKYDRTMNRYRRSLGLHPLRGSALLSWTAADRTVVLVSRHYFGDEPSDSRERQRIPGADAEHELLQHLAGGERRGDAARDPERCRHQSFFDHEPEDVGRSRSQRALSTRP